MIMRELFGALLNQLNLLRTKGMLVIVVAGVVAIVGYLINRGEVFYFAAMFVFLFLIPVCMLNTTSVSFGSKWVHFERLWGISQTVLILSRYVVYVLVSLAISGLWMLSPLYDGNPSNIVLGLVMVLLTGAFYYPVMYFLNSGENEGLGAVVIIFAFVIASFVLVPLVNLDWLMVFGILSGLHVVSLALSVIFDKFHFGRRL